MLQKVARFYRPPGKRDLARVGQRQSAKVFDEPVEMLGLEV